jgi:monoamine oxidase
VIVGAGLAGLTCAYRLRQAGIASRVFEAQQRVGGRCWSTRSVAPGLVAEHGGELIAADHTRVAALARELGLELEDRGDPGRPSFVLDGRRRAPAVVAAGRDAMTARLERDAARIGRARAGAANAAARELDELSAEDWIDANVDGGSRSLLGRAVSSELCSAFGLDARELSAIELVWHHAGDDPDGRLRVRGGNDQLPRKLAALLPERALRVGSAMQGLRRRPSGEHEMVMDRYRNPVRADVVVLTQPLPALRRADLADVPLPTAYRQLIGEHAMGAGTRLLLGLRRRPAAIGRWSGDLLADEPVLASLDSASGQRPEVVSGLLTISTGGAAARELPSTHAHAPPLPAVVRAAVDRLELVAPGISQELTGRAWLDAWHLNRWAGGSRAAFAPGQVTRFRGLLRRPAGRVVFAGEHTSVRAPGTLEGAVESGERAAGQVAALLRRG